MAYAQYPDDQSCQDYYPTVEKIGFTGRYSRVVPPDLPLFLI